MDNITEICVCVFMIGTLLCEIALIIAVFRGIHIFSGISVPWHLLEKLVDARKEKSSQIVSGGIARSEKSRSSVITVDEFSPEAIAPNLRKMQQSSGFGSSSGKTHSDSQLHKRDKSMSGNKGDKSTGCDDTPDSSSADAAEIKAGDSKACIGPDCSPDRNKGG
tara:strand:- start:883 stop:1374 length:492 start_codon:yes stop_codon:yes gene_type:complete